MYAVSKTALVALGKALAEELGPDGIRVNCVAPGGAHALLLSFPWLRRQPCRQKHLKVSSMPAQRCFRDGPVADLHCRA